MHYDISTAIDIEDALAGGNLAEEFSEEELDRLASSLCYAIDSDRQSREEWETSVTRWIELAAQVMGKKSHPWPNASNVKYPLLTMAATQFAARAYAALLPGTNWVSGKVIGVDKDGKKRERAIRIGKHMSFQLMEEMESWEYDMDRLLHVLPIVGTAFKKTYFSERKARNVSEFVPAQELVVDYYAKSLEEAERKTHLLYFYDNDLESRFRQGLYRRPADELVATASIKRQVNADKTQGQQNVADVSRMHDIGECHCWLDLDGDGFAEPYIVTLHLSHKKVLRIAANFSENSIFRNEETDEIYQITPTEYFTSYVFIPDPNSGVYGLGFGHLLGPLNETLNTVINQLIDSGTMSTLGGGFISKNFQLRGGTLKFKPHEWKVINAVGRDIREGIFPLPVREPSGVLFSLLGFLENSGMRLASVVDILSGDIPGQNTKATVAMAAIEQGLKVFTSIYKRLHRSFKQELKKLYKLNSQYLLEEEYFLILDDGEAEGETASIARSDYDVTSIDVLPYSDPNVSSEQIRLAKVQAIMDVIGLGNINPKEATRRYLEATEQPDIEALMDIPEPQPNPEIMMKQMEIMHTIKKDNFNMKLDALRFEVQNIRERSVAILNLARAEELREGAQMEIYKDTLDRLAAEEQRMIDLYMQLVQEQQAEQQAQQQQQQPPQ